MKVKELHKNVNVAWSPQAHYPLLLAAGTAAQQLDASFSTSASLDLYSLNLQQPGYDMQLSASVPSDERFHKIVWGAYGNDPAGIIVGGCDQGKIKIYSAAKVLAKDSNSLLSSPERHKGSVKAMDLNPFQSNLLATGSTESEIFIWDLNNLNTPMSPGPKSMPAEDVQHIAWNEQVEHILASTFSQRCVIWDLRKNEAIIKLHDANSRVRWKSVQWHPDVATQLCLASEDDQSPIIELWDLRFATSPLKTLHNHQRGVLAIAWNQQDSDLLLSCAKDNRILCWNPNSDAPNGEVVCELAQTSQWNFDVLWCPRHPDLVVGTSFDGVATVYSILGGHNQQSAVTSNKIVESFPGMDPFTQPPPSAVHHTDEASILKKAPKWLKKPFGASFGFGGKLTTFENLPVDPNMPANTNRRVYVSQVITNPDLIQRSNELEAAVKTGQFSDFCKGKADNAKDEHTRKVWNCIGAYFGENVSQELLELLGFELESMNNKLNQFVPHPEIENVTKGIENLNNGINGNTLDGSAAFDAIAEKEQNKSVSSALTNKKLDVNFKIDTLNGNEGLITQAILLGNIEAAVALCFDNKKYADAIVLSMAGGAELLAQTRKRYFSEHSGTLNSLINSLVSENWEDVAKNCDIDCWKEALIGIFTHVNTQRRSALIEILADRLAASDSEKHRKDAQICYICSGNLNKTIEVAKMDLQETVEIVTVMQRALEFHLMQKIEIEGNIASVLTRYAELLAAEGDLEAAINYLGNSQEPSIVMLRDRLHKSLGLVQIEPQRPNRNAQYTTGYAQNQPLQRKSIPGMPQAQSNMFNPIQPQAQSNMFNPIQPPAQSNMFNPIQPPSNASSMPPQQPSWNTAPTKQSFNNSSMNYPGVANNQSYPSTQPATPFVPSVPQAPPSMMQDPYTPQAPLTPAIPPPPPTSATNLSQSSGSRPGSVGPQSKSKYVVDPSVKSGSTYGPGGYGSASGFGPTGGYGYGGMQQPQPSYPAPNATPQQVQQPSLYTPTPVAAQTLAPSTYTYPNDTPSYQSGNQSSGWNDPPIYSKSNKAQPKTEFQQQNPIMHPLGGATHMTEPTVYQPDPNYQQHQQMGPQGTYNQFNSAPGMQSYNRAAEPPIQPAQIVRVPEPEKPKAPIPEEHKKLQSTFNELKDRCFEVARNPQLKKKIEDVSRKLEVFYDYLREQKISPSTLQGLHQICDTVQAGDYQGGLSIHTQLVSGPDFSQIASFMPGIKVLLQTALQLNVYLR
ncbi:protein transport protein Sec31A [Trichogramma pretiosum]|uniref:protein transport protein Sec31A n=1 Tax=Trichogramma pretiosum TaxID=7493 RepID=UPI0006C958C2|nr:protein transport protein Sec31A [Trichogramma pretiosum]